MYRSEEFDAIPITSSLCLGVVVPSYLDGVASSYLDGVLFWERIEGADNCIVPQCLRLRWSRLQSQQTRGTGQWSGYGWREICLVLPLGNVLAPAKCAQTARANKLAIAKLLPRLD